MIKTPYNIHLFLRVGDCVPINYFNPPRDCDYVIAFRISELDFQSKIGDCDKFHFRKTIDGWLLENIVEGNIN